MLRHRLLLLWHHTCLLPLARAIASHAVGHAWIGIHGGLLHHTRARVPHGGPLLLRCRRLGEPLLLMCGLVLLLWVLLHARLAGALWCLLGMPHHAPLL